jgi:hypothetical protein
MKLALYILLIIPLEAESQLLAEASRIELTSKDGEEIVLYSTYDCDQCYYYLPTSLRISKNGRTPETSFILWREDKTSQVIGGILHFLVEWGLDTGVDTEVQRTLRSGRDSVAVIMGSVLVSNSSYSVIEGDDRLARLLSASMKNTPSVPTTPGAKMALSFRFTEKEIEDFLYYLKNPDKVATNLRITYTYAVYTVEGQMRTNEATLRLPFREILITLKPGR